MFRVVKLEESGRVAIVNIDTSEVIASFDYATCKVITQSPFSNEPFVEINYDNGTHNLFPSKVDETQVEPDIAVPFMGDVYDLAELLSRFFFSIKLGTSTSTPTIKNVVFVESASDLPSLLLDNTTYIIRGVIKTTQQITFGVNSAIIGLNPNSDILQYTPTTSTTFLQGVDNSIFIQDLTIRSGTNTKVFDFTDYTAASPADNYGRDKKVIFRNVIFSGFYDLGTIQGFDIVDISNSFFEISDGTIGLQLQDVSKLQISSCEFIRWIRNLNYSTAKLIELLPNGIDNIGFGATNINGTIIHPRETQIGFSVNNLSTTSYGTITGNTFVDAGLTTGLVTDIDVNDVSGAGYVVSDNQGITNLIGKVEMRLSNNVALTNMPTINTPVQINGANNFTFPVAERIFTNSSGTIEGNLTRPVNFFVVVQLNCEMQNGGNNQIINFYLASNGVVIPYTKAQIEADANVPQTLTFSVNGLSAVGNVFSIYVENASNATTDIIIKEVALSGFGL